MHSTDLPSAVRVPVRYARCWPDGFGVRGWKLDLPGAGADVIAATPHAGERIATSVFVHGIMDHHLCGFGLSGYLDGAGALVQLARRTGSDPVADFQQIIDEDLLPGAVASPDWVALLPPLLRARVADHDDATVGLRALHADLGPGLLRAMFTAGFIEQGWRRDGAAQTAWSATGLAYAARPRIGLALQALFDWMDGVVQEERWPQASGSFWIDDDAVGFAFQVPGRIEHRVAVGGV